MHYESLKVVQAKLELLSLYRNRRHGCAERDDKLK